MGRVIGFKNVETKVEGDIHYRKCTKCDKWLTVENYYSNNKNNPYWIDSVCKSCRREKSLERQKIKRDEINQQNRQKKLEERGFQSPFNYLANKYLLLPQIMPLIPKNINTCVDLFAGSCTFGINSGAKKIICNDIDSNIITFYNACKEMKSESILNMIYTTIDMYNLNHGGREAFDLIKSDFNNGKNNWNVFYSLVSYSFNQHPLYTKQGKFTTGYGKGLTHFNFMLEKRLKEFSDKIKEMDISFINCDFKKVDLSVLGKGDFVYADPPYLISSKTYEWNLENELKLLDILDELDSYGVNFALSNILKHKKGINDTLVKWSKKYKTYRLQRNYSRLSRGSIKDTNTTEVLITNYCE